VDEYLRIAERERAKIVRVMDTHLHADHIIGGHELAKTTSATYYISYSEMQDSNRIFELLENHSVIRFGHVNVKVMAIPTSGHTPGSMSFLVNEQFLLSGDTIFVGGLVVLILGERLASGPKPSTIQYVEPLLNCRMTS